MRSWLALTFVVSLAPALAAQDARLLRQPDVSADQVVFAHGADLWVVGIHGGDARRLTSTPGVESDPHFSPDGRWIAFTSNRSGTPAVYVVPVSGGPPTRLTWYPAPSFVRGWSPDGRRILYATSRATAPTGFERLWTVPVRGGPSTLLPAPWGHDGSYAPEGTHLVVDRVRRWDVEWRGYRGGQNGPLVLLDLDNLDETPLPNEGTTDTHPVWMDGTVFFLSDRDWATNVWAYDLATSTLRQVTRFTDADVKWLAGRAGRLVVEQDGWIHTVDPVTGAATRLAVTVRGDFPWAEPRWEDVSRRARAASLSPTGQRALFEARGEIFTVPVEHGDARNLSRSPGAADRNPVWSPDGQQIAWVSDSGAGYELLIANQDGLSPPRRIGMGVSKMAWELAWAPDGSRLAFVDDDVRVRVVEVVTGRAETIDVGGVNIERGRMNLRWSPDSQWLAYAKTFPNHLRRIVAWSADDGEVRPLTDPMADAVRPAWDRDGRHLYFLASTDLALASGWANTSTMRADPSYAAYVTVLRADDPTPFTPRSDEEAPEEDQAPDDPADRREPRQPDDNVEVRIDFDGIERRIVALPMDRGDYRLAIAGPTGSVFLGESVAGRSGLTLHKFTLEDREASEFLTGVNAATVSGDGKKLLVRTGRQWRVVGTESKPSGTGGRLDVDLSMWLDRSEEWRQIFDEAWRYEQDFFYDPGMHGNDWDAVRDRYAPLVPHVRHRADLNYVLDQVNGELSVGHSFVRGGDMPAVDTSRVGVLGADLVAHDGGWRIARIYTSESWNPDLSAPLDRPGTRIDEGDYLVAIDGVPLTATDDPYRLLDGTAGRQTRIHVNDAPTMDGAWSEVIEPLRSEASLRQRAWVEDNRRRVDELSGGRLAYVWVPNTSGRGVVSFDRYLFAQQDKHGAVIDERFNGGGLLDDYMVDLMTRRLRAAITNEVPHGVPFRLPAGILGPKVLLINELAGSGGDFFPWVFRQQQVGSLIGKRTWGGLVKSSTHYALVDGGSLTAPDNAVFDPIAGQWIAENEGVPPDIEVDLDARSVAAGRDPQLERAVAEALRLLENAPPVAVAPPPFSRPSRRPGGN